MDSRACHTRTHADEHDSRAPHFRPRVVPIRVGLIGASTTGWGRLAHLPAVATIPGLEVTAASTTRLESAQQTAAEFGVSEAYDNPDELIASDAVDIVIVAVRVEHHFELLQKVAHAGKPVYSEWPSGSNLQQTRALRDAFRSRGIPAFTGLQARSAPAVRYLRDLVQDGYVGQVLSTTLVGAAAPWGDVVDSRNAYLQDDSLGGTMLTIPFGHTIDAACQVLGEFDSLAAMTAIQRPVVRLEGTDDDGDQDHAGSAAHLGQALEWRDGVGPLPRWPHRGRFAALAD